MRSPDCKTLVKLANILDVSADYLLGRVNCPRGIVVETNFNKSSDESLYELDSNTLNTMLTELKSFGFNLERIIEQMGKKNI